MRAASGSTDPRRRAVATLVRVETRGAYAARLLADAAPLARELVLGVLRWQLTLDTLLATHARRPLAELEPPVRASLRVGLYEAHRLATPVPVAVAEAVRVAKEEQPRAAGLVNAILRRAVSHDWPDPGDEGVSLAVRFSHPEWLVARWLQRLGHERLLSALAADQEPASLWLLAAASDPERLVAEGCALTPHPTVGGVLSVDSGVRVAVAALQEGRAYAIDPSAVLVARLLPAGDGPVADLAAAPGGKSLVLCHQHPGLRIIASDRHFGRCLLTRRTLSRAARGSLVAAADGARPCLRPGTVPAVLLDAPCSGTGTLRRHPEIRWRLAPGRLAELAQVQRELAGAAATLLAPRGHLLYATCSLEPEENEEIVRSLDLEPVPLASRLPDGVDAVELPSGGVILPPGPRGDGFVAHLLRRRG